MPSIISDKNITPSFLLFQENACGSSDAEYYDEDISEEDDEPPRKVFIPSDSTPQVSQTCSNNGSQDAQKSTDSSSSESKAKESEEENSTIISQIKQINNALILSNKAKAASSQNHTTPSTASDSIQPSSVASLVSTVPTLTSSTILQSTPSLQLISPVITRVPPQVPIQISENVKAVPLIVQTDNGVGFASVSDGMILGMIQGAADSKFVAIPLNSVVTSGVGIPTAPATTEGER